MSIRLALRIGSQITAADALQLRRVPYFSFQARLSVSVIPQRSA
jgi:hypothetical protein